MPIATVVVVWGEHGGGVGGGEGRQRALSKWHLRNLLLYNWAWAGECGMPP